ncbi:MAG: hypothetical protein K6G88_07430 [Lachnospiraceae bacterium]|nr:hypothetical protein [Lachnospiraceae bacterium]
MMKTKTIIIVVIALVLLCAFNANGIKSAVEYDDELKKGAYFTASVEDVETLLNKEFNSYDKIELEEWDDNEENEENEILHAEFQCHDNTWNIDVRLERNKVISVLLSTSGMNNGEAEDYEIRNMVKFFSDITGCDKQSLTDSIESLIVGNDKILYENGVMIKYKPTD